MIEELRNKIESAWDNQELLKDESYQAAIRQLIELLDKGSSSCGRAIKE
ncbi:MAG: hypothetical protein R2764_07115 [Bacteroidales bacterium]